MEKLSVFVTTYNNDATLARCLKSVAWADEIVLLDSFSNDATLEIAKEYGCQVSQHEFMGYGPQKQMALDKTTHRWVLLMDADEEMTAEGAETIRLLLAKGPNAGGYALPRVEQMFWRMAGKGTRHNYFLRLFDKTKGHVSDQPIHAAPKVDGRVEKLEAPFYHFGEPDIHTKVEKINYYSTGLVADKERKGKRANPWIMIFYPPLFFIRLYIFKRQFLNGWAGFISAKTGAFYAFLKYAKLYESARAKPRDRHD